VTDRPPHVQARPIPLDPRRNVVVELCAFRLCDWTSPDTRTATREVVDDLVREHLLDAHRRELVTLGRLARDVGFL
jgi:hypothetical protein